MKRVEKVSQRRIFVRIVMRTRLSAAARAPKLQGYFAGRSLRYDTQSELVVWVEGVPQMLPEEMRPMVRVSVKPFKSTAKAADGLGTRLPTTHLIDPHPHSLPTARGDGWLAPCVTAPPASSM